MSTALLARLYMSDAMSTRRVPHLSNTSQSQTATRQAQAIQKTGKVAHEQPAGLVRGLKQPLEQIETLLERERQLAKDALAQGNKQRALIALRQRKYQENLLSQTDSQLETLQKLVSLSIRHSLKPLPVRARTVL